MIFFRSHYQRAKALYQRYERYLMPLMLVAGFFTDYITFINIQVSTSLMVLSGYFVIASIGIMFVRYYDAGFISEKLKFVRLFSPLAIQYTFGASW
ncbi:hypothetical protein BK004_00470 [bacterium CG10_46_32]|nr:MAG: hypothetical protein BK004_00470 [bacterium CG10_46_32]PIR56501.1 MAG: hypothetical protein COU73_00465 [Parcubacteria group bacterium CG10_big_fil_rev_8_21_14_0_10_46_32]